MTPFLVKYGKKLFGGKQTPGDLNHKALQAIKGGDLQGAIRLLTRAVGIDPDYLTGWYNLAQVQRQAGQIELSVRSLQHVLDRDASYPDAWTSQGNSYMALQKLQEARRCFRKAVEINRNDLRAWHNLSVAAGRLGYANEVKEARAEEARLAHADPQLVARALEEDRDGRIPVRTPTSGDPLSSHRLIGASQSVGVNAETVIPPGISVVFFKAEHGLFLIGVEDFQLEKMIQDNAVKSMLRKASSMFDRVILGEILQNYEDATDYTATPATTDPELRAWVDKIAKQFWTIIDGFRRWPSFTDFLMADNLYNPITTDYGHQIPLDYWWLTGNVAPRRGIHHASCCPDGIGVFVYPQTGLLPVFTSALYGDIIAQEIRSKLGVDLVPNHLPCFKCFLTGIHGDLGSSRIKGAILNDQWELECFDCTEAPGNAGHFYLLRTLQLFKITGAAFNLLDFASFAETAQTDLKYTVCGTEDLVATASGMPYDNTKTWYDASLLLNLRVDRVNGDLGAGLYVKKWYDTTGELTVPLVTLHNLSDPAVPYKHEALYKQKVAAAGYLSNLTSYPALGYGHCNFQPWQVLGAFAVLLNQVHGAGL